MEEEEADEAISETRKSAPDDSWSVAKLKDFLRKCSGRLNGKKTQLRERWVSHSESLCRSAIFLERKNLLRSSESCSF